MENRPGTPRAEGHGRAPDGEEAVAVRERAVEDPPVLVHPGWAQRFPWLVQGTSAGAAHPSGPFDLGLFARASPAGDVLARWERLRTWAGAVRVVHARQVHGSAVRVHADTAPGLHLAPPCDGHATRTPGVLLAVALADCVPVSVIDPRLRAVALVHAGWRGTAAGIVERGVGALRERFASRPEDLHAHLGPAICGDCYEVGPEVFEALGLEASGGPRPVDLRAVLADRLRHAGVASERISVSGHCTRCGDAGLFSHRGGDGGRHVAFLGIRA